MHAHMHVIVQEYMCTHGHVNVCSVMHVMQHMWLFVHSGFCTYTVYVCSYTLYAGFDRLSHRDNQPLVCFSFVQCVFLSFLPALIFYILSIK